MNVRLPNIGEFEYIGMSIDLIHLKKQTLDTG